MKVLLIFFQDLADLVNPYLPLPLESAKLISHTSNILECKTASSSILFTSSKLEIASISKVAVAVAGELMFPSLVSVHR